MYKVLVGELWTFGLNDGRGISWRAEALKHDLVGWLVGYIQETKMSAFLLIPWPPERKIWPHSTVYSDLQEQTTGSVSIIMTFKDYYV